MIIHKGTLGKMYEKSNTIQHNRPIINIHRAGERDATPIEQSRLLSHARKPQRSRTPNGRLSEEANSTTG